MKIINNSENAISHGLPGTKGFYSVEVGKVIEVPDNIGALWLKIKGVKEYAAPDDVKRAEEKNAELEAKIKELEEKIEKKPVKNTVKKGVKKK